MTNCWSIVPRNKDFTQAVETSTQAVGTHTRKTKADKPQRNKDYTSSRKLPGTHTSNTKAETRKKNKDTTQQKQDQANNAYQEEDSRQ